MFRTPASVIRPKVTPDPQAVAALERKFSALDYVPENGFHRDQRQPKKGNQP